MQAWILCYLIQVKETSRGCESGHGVLSSHMGNLGRCMHSNRQQAVRTP